MKRKFKEAIKEENEEKDFLFNEIKIKSQAAMEYLMTYGWAILIIALTLAVLYSLGIMNPKNFIPRSPPGSCFVFRPNGPGTTDFISLQGTCGYLPMYVASFNGVSGYVSIPGDSSIRTLVSSLTLCAWFKSTLIGGGTYHSIIEKGDNGRVGYGLLFNRVSDTLTFYLNTTTSYGAEAGPKGLLANKWYHACGVWDGTTAIIYLNGLNVYSRSQGGTLDLDTSPAYIGYYSGQYFNGTITNVQVYNTALTQQEIQYLYQQGLGGGPVRLQNLVGWWPLNGDAKDYSGNNNHGRIYGGVTFVQNYNPP